MEIRFLSLAWPRMSATPCSTGLNPEGTLKGPLLRVRPRHGRAPGTLRPVSICGKPGYPRARQIYASQICWVWHSCDFCLAAFESTSSMFWPCKCVLLL